MNGSGTALCLVLDVLGRVEGIGYADLNHSNYGLDDQHRWNLQCITVNGVCTCPIGSQLIPWQNMDERVLRSLFQRDDDSATLVEGVAKGLTNEFDPTMHLGTLSVSCCGCLMLTHVVVFSRARQHPIGVGVRTELVSAEHPGAVLGAEDC
ncbi:hypothetical protein Tco_1304766 [Tanacetum coccineum]